MIATKCIEHFVEIRMAAEAKKLWGGRFSCDTDPLEQTLNCSLPFGQTMFAEDIERTRAHTSVQKMVRH